MGQEDRWRQQLGIINRNYTADEKRQFRVRMGNIDASTVNRWIAGQVTPKVDVARKLAEVLPELLPALLEIEEFAGAIESPPDDSIALQIPRAYYEQVHRSLAKTDRMHREYDISNAVFEMVVSQLDPSGDGLLILFVKCVDPGNNADIELLCSDAGYGTGLWNVQQVQHPFSLGINSLSGFAVSEGRIALYPQIPMFALKKTLKDGEKVLSGGAFPIYRDGWVAGAFFVGSVHRDFFTNARRALIERYTELFSLALRDDQFYSRHRIKLVSVDNKEVDRV